MPDIPVTIVLPNGGARRAEMPDDVPVGELIAELTSLLKLPTVGPDGRPMGYRMDSKGLGRELTEKESLGSARIPQDDRLMITADITAGSSPIEQSPRMRRLRGDYQLIQELMAQSDLIQVDAVDAKPGLPPERYIVTYHCKSIIDVDKQGNPKFGDHHQVEIYLHAQYPQRWPGMKWLTPIWHPNINHLNGTVCIDAAWWAASRSLDRLVIMIGEMLQYKNFHDDPTKPPFPWDAEAARWCRSYREKNPNVFPLDKRELLRPEKAKRVKLGANSSAKIDASAEVKPAANPALKTGIKPAGKVMIKPAGKAQVNSPGRTGETAAANLTPKPGAAPAVKTAAKAGTKIKIKPEATPPAKTGDGPAGRLVITPPSKPGSMPLQKEGKLPEITPTPKKGSQADVKPEGKKSSHIRLK